VIPTPKSATAKETTNQLAEEYSRRFLATTKVTKAFPVAVTIESNQPIKLSKISISRARLRKNYFSFDVL